MAEETKKPVGALGLLTGGLKPSVEEVGEAPGEMDEGAESMATQGVMSALEDKDPVAFKDALATLLESMGYSKV